MENVTFRASAAQHRVNGSNLDKSNPIDARQQDSPELRAFIDSVPALCVVGSARRLPGFLQQAVPGLHRTLFGSSCTDRSGNRPSTPPISKSSKLGGRNSCIPRRLNTTEVRLRRFDGSSRWFLLFADPLRDESGNVVKWYGTNIDIEDRKRVEEILRAREESWLQIVNNIPGLVATMGATGEVEFLNRQTLEYFGKSTDDLKNWALGDAVHPDDLPRIIQARIKSIEEGTIYDVEHRCRRADGVYRWFQVRGIPVRNAEDTITAWYLLLTDIDDRKRTEQKLYESEAYLAEAQRLSQTGSWAWNPATGDIRYWSEMCYNVLGFDPAGPLPPFEEFFQRLHPEDQPASRERFEKAIREKADFELDYRIVHPEKGIRDIHAVGHAVVDGSGNLSEYVGTVIDVTERKRREQELRQSEQDLRTITDTIPQPIVVLAPNGNTLYVNQRAFDITGYTRDQLDERGYWARVVHPDDVERLREERLERLLSGAPFELEFRVLFKSGQYRWILMQYNPLKDESGQTIRWYSTATDIDDRKRAEEKLRQSEAELRTITDTVRQPIMVLAPDGTILYANRVALDNTGLTLDEVIKEGILGRLCHPDDTNRVRDERRIGLLEGVPFDVEMRLLHKGGEYRWQLLQYNPLKDESGQIIRWYATATNIDDRKKAEERLRNENVKLAQERVYLEEQIRSEMGFEHIIGNSPALQHVLELVETVAPNDSTVLLLGETGTGKELIARAVHERSRRKTKTFAKLNCAAIPTGLLESELFGHEKGAFTGAIIQKAGRMELADQGTLFLDEVGDIPIDIQPKLLRALQEKEFERLGSTHTRKVNVRLVAATNRNLEKMVADREFRSDLFYRLNVFPIRIPPLRERKDDIPLLVTYFVQKFAKQMQKRIDSIPVATMKALTAWDWPGNIRELENFIERAVILTQGESLAAPLAELRKGTTDEAVQASAPKTEEDIARIVKETIASMKRKTAPSERIEEAA